MRERTLVSFFSQGADGANNPFITELDETNTFLSPLERFNLNALGHYDITDNLRVFFEGLYAHYGKRATTRGGKIHGNRAETGSEDRPTRKRRAT